ncbi:hypothetical protein ACQB60_32385 [Actinomycetota bacterium Odt1-20B]
MLLCELDAHAGHRGRLSKIRGGTARVGPDADVESLVRAAFGLFLTAWLLCSQALGVFGVPQGFDVLLVRGIRRSIAASASDRALMRRRLSVTSPALY